MIFKTLKCQGSKRVLPLVSACLDVRPQPHPPFCLLHVTLGWKTFDFISQSLNLIKEIIVKSFAVFNLFIQPLFTSSCGKDDKLSWYGGQLTFCLIIITILWSYWKKNIFFLASWQSSYGGQLSFCLIIILSLNFFSHHDGHHCLQCNEGGISRLTIKRSKPAQNLRLPFSNCWCKHQLKWLRILFLSLRKF